MKTKSLKARCAAVTCALACAITTFNCFNDPLTPVPPRWDTNFTVPLSNRTLTLDEMVQRDSSLLRTGAGNQLVYVSSTTGSPSVVNDKISLVPSPASGSMKLGTFAVVLVPVVVPIQIPGLPSNTPMVVPATALQSPDMPNAVTIPATVRLASGRVRLTLTNNMPVAIAVDTTIVIWDGSVAQARFVFPAMIPAGGSAWAEDDLSGRSIGTGDGLIGLHFHTPGSGTATVTIPSTPLTATITTSNLIANTLVGSTIPAQRITDGDVTGLAVRDSTKVQTVTVRSGRLDISLTSRLAIDVRLIYRLNELRRSLGGISVVYEDSVMLAAGGTQSLQLNLAGWTLASANPGQLLDSIHFATTVVIPTAITQSVTVHDTDRVVVSMRSGAPIIADTAVVVLKPTWVDINTAVPLHFGQLSSRFTGQLNIPAASLDLRLSSSVGFPADLYITIKARKASGDSAMLVLPASQRRIVPGTGSVIFDNADVGQFLSQFSTRLPDSARVVGSVLINPPDMYVPTPAGVGRIGRNSAVGATMNVRVPMHVGIADGVYLDTLAWGDTNGDGTKDSSFDRDVLTNVNNGVLYAEIRNGLPLQIGLSIRLLDQGRQNLLNIPQNGSDIQVSAASVDADGIVTLPANSSVVVRLGQTDVQQFIPAAFVRTAVKLNSASGGNAVTFRTTDGLHVKVWSQLSCKVNP